MHRESFSIHLVKVSCPFPSSSSTTTKNHLQDIVKGIVHFEIKMWYLSAYPKGIQDVGVFFSSVDPILIFLRSNRSSLSVI